MMRVVLDGQHISAHENAIMLIAAAHTMPDRIQSIERAFVRLLTDRSTSIFRTSPCESIFIGEFPGNRSAQRSEGKPASEVILPGLRGRSDEPIPAATRARTENAKAREVGDGGQQGRSQCAAVSS